MKSMLKTSTGIAVLALAMSWAGWALSAEETENAEPAETAAEAPGPDTSLWECRFCPVEYGLFGHVDAGALYVSDENTIYRSYTGYRDGWHFLGDGYVRSIGENGQFWNLKFRNLGLDSRDLEAEGGRQGSYRFRFAYSQIPVFTTQGAATPFLGAGAGTQLLPEDWVRAPTTGGMTALDSSLQPVNFGHKRETFDLGVLFNVGLSRWQFGVDYRHDRKNGFKAYGGAFMFTAAQFAEPIDYTTDSLDATAAYIARDVQVQLAYYGSFFNQGFEGLTWQNPFNAVVPGADFGRTALAPDNQFHQLSATVNYSLNEATDAVASVAFGRGKQDEDLLPYTINPLLNPDPLPRGSADGEVNTLNANLKLVSQITDRLDGRIEYRFRDRNNDTPQQQFRPVVTDVFVSPLTQTNPAYSFQSNQFRVSGDYRYLGDRKLGLGFDRLVYRREFQDIARTEDDMFWGEIDIFSSARFLMDLRLEYSERDGSVFDPDQDVNPPNNPALRRFNMADRERNLARLFFTAMPSDIVTFGGSVDYSRDDYSAEYGRTNGKYKAVNLDISVMPTSDIVTYGYYSYEDINTDVDGREVNDLARDWFARTQDQIETIGLGVEFQGVADKLDLGLDLNHSRAKGEYAVSFADEPVAPFPGLLTNLDSVRAYAIWAFRERLDFGFSARYDRYHSDDWAVDDVDVDTIFNVLTLGNDAPDFDVWVFGAWLRYSL